MKRPYYVQYNEDTEPEFIGWFESQDEAIDDMVKTGASYRIGEMTCIDVIDEGMLDMFEDDDEYEALVKYFRG